MVQENLCRDKPAEDWSGTTASAGWESITPMDQLRKPTLVALFVLGAVAPILIMLLAPQPPTRQWWRDGAVALGFLGFALMGWQFVPMAWMPFLTETFGTGTLIQWHSDLSLVALYLVLAHPLVLMIGNPRYLVAFNVLTGVGRLRSGVVALLLTLVIVATCLWRRRLNLRRRPWRWLHDLLAAAIMGFALHHVLRVGYYTFLPLQRWLWIGYVAVWGILVAYTRGSAELARAER